MSDCEGLTPVPFLDLRPSHEPLKAAIVAGLADLIDRGAFTGGAEVGEFETAFASYCEAGACVGVSSGLDALRLALISAGAGPGSEVILPAQTFAATVESVIQAGAQPVLVDVTDADYNIDPVAVEAAITPNTAFLLPVHLYGQMADMRALGEIAGRHDLKIIEDGCQAHGATRDGNRVGSAGLAAAFSFYPAKNLGAFGDAGACVTDDLELAARVRALREHGQPQKNVYEYVGYTARLDTLQALVLLHKLPFLDRWNEERRSAANFYSQSLEGLGDLVLPGVPEGSEPVWHLYVVRSKSSARLAAFLRERQIGTGRHYPQPLHVLPAYADLGYAQGAFPNAEELAANGLSLPIFPGMKEAQLHAVLGAVADFFARG